MSFAEQFKKAADTDKNKAADMLVQEVDLERNSFINFLLGCTPPLKASFATAVTIHLEPLATVSFNDEGELSVQSVGDGDENTKQAVELAYEKLQEKEDRENLTKTSSSKTTEQILEDMEKGEPLPTDLTPEQMEEVRLEMQLKLNRMGLSLRPPQQLRAPSLVL